MFTVEDPAAKVYDLQAADLKNYVNAIEMFIQHLAAQTNTPPHYLLGNMVNISGDALTAAESGLVSKVEDKKDPFGEAHEDMMRLAFLSMGDVERANADDAETLWAPSERRSFAQVVDGASKLAQIGFPPETVAEELGWSPQRIARVKTQMIADERVRPLQPPAPAARERNGRDLGECRGLSAPSRSRTLPAPARDAHRPRRHARAAALAAERHAHPPRRLARALAVDHGRHARAGAARRREPHRRLPRVVHRERNGAGASKCPRTTRRAWSGSRTRASRSPSRSPRR
jgi:hypothetical protein